jgi:hypothetical protein
MRIYLLLVVAYTLMASCIAKEQRNLGFFTSLAGSLVGGWITRKHKKKHKNLQEVDTDASKDLLVSTLV